MELSIIIINYNTKQITTECLRSIIEKTKDLTFEIIVVDNASSDGSVEVLESLKKRNPNLRLIKNRENRGFGPANNQGLKIAKGKFILLLNTDTIIHDNVLYKIVDWMKKRKKVGIATCALRNKDGSMQGTGGYFPTLFRVFSWMFFLEDIPLIDTFIKPFHPIHGQSPFYKGGGIFMTPHQQDWITGAFMLVKKEVVNQVGLFDEKFFMYTEEVDYCYRAKKIGWEVWYEPSWSITHLGGASSTSEFPILSEYKGIKIFYKNHMARWQYPVLRGLLKAGAFLRMLIFGVLKGKEAARTYAKAFKFA